MLAITAASILLPCGAPPASRRGAACACRHSSRVRASSNRWVTLAGGVAHDFNNVLAAIVGFRRNGARTAAPPGSDQARHLDKMLQAALRGKSLVERILTFSRGGARTSTVFELETIVEEVLSLLSASLRPGVVLERRLEAHGARLRGDPTQAFEAVMNLCTNAMQAMPEGGMLSVQLERRHVGRHARAVAQPGRGRGLSGADRGRPGYAASRPRSWSAYSSPSSPLGAQRRHRPGARGRARRGRRVRRCDRRAEYARGTVPASRCTFLNVPTRRLGITAAPSCA